MTMRPFFSYFGGKWTLAPRYPAPEHAVIVEPFAGSAGYATRYPEREVILVERAPHIAALWRWLIGVSVDEVLALPLDPRAIDGCAPDAQVLIRFWCARGRTRRVMARHPSWLLNLAHNVAVGAALWTERRKADDLRRVVLQFRNTVSDARRAAEARGRGGQHVPFMGDFASAPPSTMARLAWWAREMEISANQGDVP